MSQAVAATRPEVTVVDLGLGNLRSVARAFERAGAIVRVESDPDRYRGAERLVLPGQGAFRDAARALGGRAGAVIRACIAEGRPVFGICLGMQVLFESSEEAPDEVGLGLLSGRVKRFAADMRDPATAERLKVPHMGWNEVASNPPWLPTSAHFYFVHSYYCEADDPAVVAATTTYGPPFCAAVAFDRVFGCQFHPEKSQAAGAELIARFLEQTWS